MNTRYTLGAGTLTFTQRLDVSKAGVATNEQLVLPMTPDEALQLADLIHKQHAASSDDPETVPNDLLFLRNKPKWSEPEGDE